MIHTPSSFTLFVYGTLMRKQRYAYFLRGARFICQTQTLPLYFLRHMGEYPALQQGGRSRVYGELYRVGNGLLQQLDNYEECPELYVRQHVMLKCNTPAIAYFIRKNKFMNKKCITNGRWSGA